MEQMNYSKLPIISRLIRRLNQEFGIKGIQLAMREVLKNTGSEVFVSKSGFCENVLKNEPVIVVANHPAEADVPVLIASLEDRKDLYLIINSGFLNIFPNFDKQLIPVYINNRLFNKSGLKIRLKLFQKLTKFKILPKEEEHRRNVENIKLAGNRINTGSMVVVFPGGGGEKGKWFSGIGHLIKEINSDKAFVVKAYIEGTSDKDYLRFIPGFSKLLPKFKVSLSDPVLINEFTGENPKEIASNLEQNYNDWVTGLKINKRKNIPVMWPSRSFVFARTVFLWLVTRGS